MIISIYRENLVLNQNARGPWCNLSYLGHPKGCPNFGKKKTCPPFSKSFEDLLTPPFFLVADFLNLEAHAKRMKILHPNWTDRQARCLLYWQGSLRKKVRQEAEGFLKSQKGFFLLETPEASGVDVFNTCKKLDIFLERNPKKLVWKVMIIGKRKESEDIV